MSVVMFVHFCTFLKNNDLQSEIMKWHEIRFCDDVAVYEIMTYIGK